MSSRSMRVRGRGGSRASASSMEGPSHPDPHRQGQGCRRQLLEQCDPDGNCQGWGISDGTTAGTAWAEKSIGAPQSLTGNSYAYGGVSATSDVDAAGIFWVTHEVETVASSSSIYQITVNVTNSTLVSRSLRYRRVMD